MTQHKRPDAEELLFTLDQLQQTTEVMSRVVARLKHQLLQLQAAQSHSTDTSQAAPALKQAGRRLH